MPPFSRVMTRRAAIAAGLSDEAIAHRLARGSWTRLHAGVYFTVGPEPAYRDRLAGAVLAGGAGAALSGAAVLHLWRLRDIAPPRRPLVLIRPMAGSVSTDIVQFRRTAVPFDPQVVDGVATAGIARSLVDHCLTVTSLATVQALVSEAVRTNLCGVEALTAAYRSAPQRGSANLRMALEDVRLGAWSLPEARIGRALRAARVPPFEQNAAVRDAQGHLLGVIDVWWEQLRAALEIHGAEHHGSAFDWAATVRRSALLSEHGIAVMQVPAADVLRDLPSVVARVERWLERLAGATPS
jgi:hypothetical protein